jgi:hypothetical protein
MKLLILVTMKGIVTILLTFFAFMVGMSIVIERLVKQNLCDHSGETKLTKNHYIVCANCGKTLGKAPKQKPRNWRKTK